MDRCTLYLPFEIPENQEIKEPLPFEGLLNGYPVKIEKNAPYYALVIENVESTDRAAELLLRLRNSLHLWAIEQLTAVRVDAEAQDFQYVEDPALTAQNLKEQGLFDGDFLDALIDGAMPAIYRQRKNVLRLTGQRASLGLGFSPANILASCERSLSLPLTSPEDRGYLDLAIDVYSYAKFETSGSARFIILCTVLEVLAPPSAKIELTENTIQAFNMLKKSIRKEMNECKAGTAEYNLLQNISSRIGGLERESHSGRIKTYIENSLREANRADLDKAKRAFSKFYSRRGNLVHEGKMDIGEEVAEVDELVRFLLAYELQRPRRRP
jgi:hypothetical protein